MDGCPLKFGRNGRKWDGGKLKNERLIDWIVFYVVSAIFQPYNSGEKWKLHCWYKVKIKNMLDKMSNSNKQLTLSQIKVI